jgi:hypothetical protein
MIVPALGGKAITDAARQQQEISATGVHHAGAISRGIAGAPKKIAAHRAFDRTSGILRDQQAPHTLCRREALFGFEPERNPHRDKSSVDGNAALWGQSHALGSDRAIAANLPEKDI